MSAAGAPPDGAGELEIGLLRPGEEEAFRALNLAWLEGSYELEPIDREILDDPRGRVLGRGGLILCARRGDEVVGVAALLAEEGRFELSKMAVHSSERGRGIGQALLCACLSQARERGARSVVLVTGSELESAVRLYERCGFRVVRRGPHPDYARADLEMELCFDEGP